MSDIPPGPNEISINDPSAIAEVFGTKGFPKGVCPCNQSSVVTI